MPEKVLSIGAGKHQTPLIKAIRDSGYLAVAVDIDPQADGVKYADIFYPVSIFNRAEVIKCARQVKTDAVITASSLLGAGKTVSAVAQSLGLKGPSAKAITNSTNKLKLKSALLANGIPTPRFGELSSDALNQPEFPVLLKPVSGVGGENIKYFKKPENIRKQSWDTACFWEEYLEGEGISLYGLVGDEVCQCILAANKKHSGPPDFTRHELTPIPFRRKYQDLFQKIVKVLGINFGPFFQIDCLKRGGELYVIDVGIEIDPQIAGLLNSEFQRNIYREMIKLAL